MEKSLETWPDKENGKRKIGSAKNRIKKTDMTKEISKLRSNIENYARKTHNATSQNRSRVAGSYLTKDILLKGNH